MKTELFENELRELPWRKPPASLKARIFGPAPKERTSLIRLVFGRHIELGWAAALVACAGLAGFGLGRLGYPTALNPLPRGSVEVHLIETGEGRSLFNLTETTQDPWPGSLQLEIEQTEDRSG